MSGLLALLDDVVALTKLAAATLDDAAGQAIKASSKAAGVVVDDAAVTPRYVTGLAAKRELPIIGRIALGSLKNKLVFLLPAALLLTAFLPGAIIPLLMLGGLYLCYEGFEKVHHMLSGPDAIAASKAAASSAVDATALEDEKVAGAIRTDFILSAEIMAIALASITAPDLVTKALVLAAVGIMITVAVYGTVALIVKADDFGVYLAQRENTVLRTFGRGLVHAMPPFLQALELHRHAGDALGGRWNPRSRAQRVRRDTSRASHPCRVRSCARCPALFRGSCGMVRGRSRSCGRWSRRRRRGGSGRRPRDHAVCEDQAVQALISDAWGGRD